MALLITPRCDKGHIAEDFLGLSVAPLWHQSRVEKIVVEFARALGIGRDDSDALQRQIFSIVARDQRFTSGWGTRIRT